MSIFSTEDIANSIKPIVEAAVAEAITGLSNQVAPAIASAFQQALDGLSITVSFSKKDPNNAHILEQLKAL